MQLTGNYVIPEITNYFHRIHLIINVMFVTLTTTGNYT